MAPPCPDDPGGPQWDFATALVGFNWFNQSLNSSESQVILGRTETTSQFKVPNTELSGTGGPNKNSLVRLLQLVWLRLVVPGG